jgi:hypothetical protein
MSDLRNFAKTTNTAASSPLIRPSWRKILAPILLAPLFFAATAATVPNVWAEQATLLNGNSPDWQASSSGDVSPDGVWELEYPGSGEVEISNGVMQLRPELSGDSRHSTLVLAREVDYKGIHGKTDVRLDQVASGAEPWDSFWAMLAYVDQTTQITIMIRNDEDPGGWLVSKRDHDHEGQDLHETIAEGDSIPKAEIGHWYNVEWWIRPTGDNGDLHVKVVVDGETLVNKVDDAGWDRGGTVGEGTSAYFVNAGKTFGAYSENSYTSWRNIWVESLASGAQGGSVEEEESQPSDSGQQQESTNDSASGEGSGDSSSDEEQAESDINDADSQIDQADSDDSGIEEASQLLDQANGEFESGDYEAATNTAREAIAALGG